MTRPKKPDPKSGKAEAPTGAAGTTPPQGFAPEENRLSTKGQPVPASASGPESQSIPAEQTQAGTESLSGNAEAGEDATPHSDEDAARQTQAPDRAVDSPDPATLDPASTDLDSPDAGGAREPGEDAPPAPDASGQDTSSGAPHDMPSDDPSAVKAVQASAAAPAPEPQPKPKPKPKRGGGAFIGLVLGGVIAAAGGFATARYLVPEGWPTGISVDQVSAIEARLETRIAAQSAEQARGLAELSGRIDEIASREAPAPTTPEAPDPALADFSARVDDGLAAIGSRLDELADRIAALEARGPAEAMQPGIDADTLSGLQADMAALATDLDALRGSIEAGPDAALAEQIAALSAAAQADRAAAEARALALRAEAEAAARVAQARAAMLRVQAAVENGGPYDQALEDLATMGVNVPAELRESAEGVPTIADLQQAFPDAARAALAASTDIAAGERVRDRFAAFLRAQTGARSLTPQDGDDPDAVLSRAEAALRANDLAAALDEISALPSAGQQELAEWRAQAQTRVAAIGALSQLTADISGN